MLKGLHSWREGIYFKCSYSNFSVPMAGFKRGSLTQKQYSGLFKSLNCVENPEAI